MSFETGSVAALDDRLKAFVNSRHAGDLTWDPKNKLISVESNTPVPEVLELLSSKNIRAVPVYKVLAGSKKYIGIISSYDIVSYIALVVCKAIRGETSTSSASGSSSFTEASFSLDRFDKVPIGDLFTLDVNTTIENSSLWSLEPTDTIATVIDYFAKGIHRVLVHRKSDRTGKLKYQLVTQTDVIRFLNQHQQELGNLFTTRIEELRMCNPLGPQRKLHAITARQSALEGFLLMHNEVLHAVPVVNDDGILVTTLSVADAKGLNRATFPKLLLPVTDFLKTQHGDRLLHPITAKPRDTLSDITSRMLSAEVHRHQVWVTNAAEQPIDAVSMTDVLRKVYERVTASE